MHSPPVGHCTSKGCLASPVVPKGDASASRLGLPALLSGMLPIGVKIEPGHDNLLLLVAERLQMGRRPCLLVNRAHIPAAFIARGDTMLVVALDVKEMQVPLVRGAAPSATNALEIPHTAALGAP